MACFALVFSLLAACGAYEIPYAYTTVNPLAASDNEITDVVATIRAGRVSVSRATLEGVDPNFRMAWQPLDAIGVFTDYPNATGTRDRNRNVKLSLGESGADEDTGEASFTGMLTFGSATGLNQIYAYYPHLLTAGTDYTRVNGVLPASQTMSGFSADPACCHMWAAHEGVQAASLLASQPVDLSFKLANAVTLVTVSGITTGADAHPDADLLEDTDYVRSMTMEVISAAGTMLTGNFTLDLTSGASDFGTYRAGANTVTVTCPEEMKVADLYVQAVTAPFTLAAGDQIKLTVKTPGFKIEKTITLTAAHTAAAGKVTPVSFAIDKDCAIVPNFTIVRMDFTGATAHATTQNGTTNPPSYAIDGNTGTLWSHNWQFTSQTDLYGFTSFYDAENNPQYKWWIDLGSVKENICQVGRLPRQNNNWPDVSAGFYEVSIDGSLWTRVGEFDYGPREGTGANQKFTNYPAMTLATEQKVSFASDVSARYIRLTITTSTRSGSVDIAEFYAYQRISE